MRSPAQARRGVHAAFTTVQMKSGCAHASGPVLTKHISKIRMFTYEITSSFPDHAALRSCRELAGSVRAAPITVMNTMRAARAHCARRSPLQTTLGQHLYEKTN